MKGSPTTVVLAVDVHLTWFDEVLDALQVVVVACHMKRSPIMVVFAVDVCPT
eukprot:CAMPEP_0198112422 /NCGR_PEP_ID=MMETSP1442-20131203/4281_1 /TAXON_ID= /ORGANISM="Craspedostauros australis, Strain CCMP3328" /LENGTH=51 /DNA_ID=CAMNT_0043769185 /DNA_START=77 /DNA_END=232 /DNA_ORIENTATION=-